MVEPLTWTFELDHPILKEKIKQKEDRNHHLGVDSWIMPPKLYFITQYLVGTKSLTFPGWFCDGVRCKVGIRVRCKVGIGTLGKSHFGSIHHVNVPRCIHCQFEWIDINMIIIYMIYNMHTTQYRKIRKQKSSQLDPSLISLKSIGRETAPIWNFENHENDIARFECASSQAVFGNLWTKDFHEEIQTLWTKVTKDCPKPT